MDERLRMPSRAERERGSAKAQAKGAAVNKMIEEAPSRKSIAKATIVALFAAAVLLVTIVLPAEYGIDPLGTGSALGLTDLAAAATDSVQTGVNTSQPRIYKTDSRDITLFPGEGIEIKYHMEQGATMVYSWKATGPVLFEFHGEPDKKPTRDYYDSYELDDKVGKAESYGSFIAPSTGIHGWFWENKGATEVTIRLNTAGFYDRGKQFSAAGIKDFELEDVK